MKINKIFCLLALIMLAGCASKPNNNRVMTASGLDKYIESPCACNMEIGNLNKALI